MSLWWRADPFSNDAPSKERMARTSLVAQGFKLHTPIAEGMGSIPGWGTKIPYAPQQYQKKKKKMNNCTIGRSHLDSVYLSEARKINEILGRKFRNLSNIKLQKEVT